MKKRIISIILSLVMVVGLLPSLSLPAMAAGPLNIANGSISIVNGTSGTITVKQNNADVTGCINIDPATDITLTGTTTTNPVTVEVSASVTVNLTLDDFTMNITSNDYERDSAAMRFITGNANLTIRGTNTISMEANYGSSWRSALRVDGKLTIDGTGTLNVRCSNNGASHGIYAKELLINSGTLICQANSTGILADTTVTFNGGSVNATAGLDSGCRGIWASCILKPGASGSVSATGRTQIAGSPFINTDEILAFSNGSRRAGSTSMFDPGTNPPNNITFTYSPAPTTVSLAPGSLGVVGNCTITGLTSGCMYKVTEGTGTPTIKWVQNNGKLSATESSVGALTGNSITNLTNGTTYLVEQVFPVTLTIAGGNGTDSVTMAGTSYNSGTATIHPVKGTSVVVSASPDAARGATFTGGLTAAGTISDISENISFTVTFAALAPTVGSISPATIKTGEVPNLTAPTVNYNGLSSVSAGWEIKKSGGAYTTYTGTALDVSYHGASLRYFAKNSAGTAYSNEALVTVNKLSPAVSISASPSSPQTYPIPSGIVLTATLSNAYQLSGQTITFKNGGTTLGTGLTDAGGIANYTVSTPSSGTYNFTAGFEADANNNLATSSQVSYTINKGTQSTPSFANTTAIDKKITDTSFLLPTVSGGEGTGNYSYTSSDTNVLTVLGTENMATVTIVGVGNATIKVQKLGDANYNDSAYSEDISIAISKHTPTAADFTYTAPTALAYDNTAKSATVTAKSGISGMGKITVKYFDKDGVTVDAPTNAGTYTVKIIVAQGGNYVAASDITDSAWTFTIAKVAQATLTITEPTGVVTYGETFTLAATGGSGNGDVAWAVTKGNSATVKETTGFVTITGVSETTITATKAADGNYAAEVTDTYIFTPAKLQLTVDAPTVTSGWTKTYDGNTAFDKPTITVGGITNRVGTDAVTVTVESATFDTANVGSAKNLTITYSIGGDASGKYTVPTNTVISTASITSAIPTSADFAYTSPKALGYDKNAKTATVTAKSDVSGMGAVTVKYYSGGVETSPTNAGTYTVKISVVEGDNYSAVTELTNSAWTFTIAKAAQDSLSITNKPTSVTYGNTFALSATGGSGTGTLTWESSNVNSATVGANGVVIITGVGETTITAKKAADGNYTAEVTATYKFTPAKLKLTVDAPTATSGWTKTYDGKTDFEKTNIAAPKITNKVGSDAVNVSVESATFDTSDVGSDNKTLTITYSIGGDASGNYSAPADTVIANASITAATPTITLKKKTATYDGKIVDIDAATVKGVTGDTTPDGTITYTYYTKDTCTDGVLTSVDKSGAASLGGAPKNGGTYYVKATIAAKGNYTQAKSDAVTLTIYYPSSGENETGAPVIVDGKTIDMGTSEVKDGKTTVTVDQNKITEQLKNAKDSVIIPITSKTDTASAQLVVQNVERMAARDMTLSVKVNDISYDLPATAVDTATLLNDLGATDSAKVPLNIVISHLPKNAVTIKGGTLMLAPVSFTVTASFNGRSVAVDSFESYVQRDIELPSSIDPKTITTAVVVESNGTERHVPTEVYLKSGKWYAKVNSMTNSTYALIQNSASFTDSKGQWYDTVVTEMVSRKIINGVGENVFAGDLSITRAEFAAIIVRALGLPTNCTSTFADVTTSAWYNGAVGTAFEHGIVSGVGDNRFDPNANITREEAMVMVTRAAKLCGMDTTGSGAMGLTSFEDATKISSWAYDSAAFNVKSALIKGDNGKISPNAAITRAETATVVLRLLQKAGLVDVRTVA